MWSIIFLYKDIFQQFFKGRKNNPNFYDCVKNIFFNFEQKILFSSNLTKYLRAEIERENLDLFNQLIKQFTFEEDKFKMEKSSKDSQNFDEEFNFLHQNCKLKVIFSLFFEKNEKSCIKNEAIYTNIAKPNFDFLIFELARTGKVSFSYNDFQKDAEVKTFFDNLYRIPQNISEIYIWDRHCNLEHPFFDSLKTVFVHYHTNKTNSPKEKNIFQKKRDLAEIFNKFKLKVAEESGQTHQRWMVFENIFVGVDNDFQYLKTQYHNWNIVVECNPQKVAKLLKDAEEDYELLR